MRRETFALALGEIDERLLEKGRDRAGTPGKTWLGSAALAAAAVLIIIFALPRGNEGAGLAESLTRMGFEPETVAAPAASGGEMPAGEGDIASFISGKTAVRGVVTDIETVKLTKPDGAMFITVFEVEAQEVLSGGVEGGTARFISAAEYTGDGAPELLTDPRIEGVGLGARGVFVGGLPEGSWELQGKAIDPAALAELLAVGYFPE